jgi:hypothetical protein
MTTISGHTTRANGTILTAAIYNADHVNHVTNAQALNATKMEGATPPVVDGHAVVWSGTSGNLLRTGGYFPATDLRQIIAGTGLTGGGNLTADRTLAVDFASQAEAEAATSIVDVMSPLRVAQRMAIIKASQAEAEAGVEDTKWMTALRVAQRQAILMASQAEAEAGTENTKTLTSLRVAQAIAALAQAITVGTTLTLDTSGVDTGIDDVKGGAFIYSFSGAGTFQVSCNGGTNYTNLGGVSTAQGGIVFIKSSIVAGLNINQAGPGIQALRIAPTVGAGNVFARMSGGGSGSVIRVM